MSAHVLIVGCGTFGSRLARLLARRGYRLTLAGRTSARTTVLARELGAEVAVLDRETCTADALAAVGCAIVVDSAGPFQGSDVNLLRAAMAAGVHYVDLADARAFVAGFGQFDAAARAAGVVAVTGASTTPALSHAVLDELLRGWQAVDRIDVAIVPGNRTPKGRSVIAGILSWVGQDVRVFEDGAWRVRPGWSGMRMVEVAGLGARRAALAEVPDLDALVERYRPRVSAWFGAGMELGLLHWLIALCGAAVRWRLLPNAGAMTGLGYRVAMLLDRFGTDDGGMLVEASGIDADGKPARVRWSLVARGGDGPFVPAVAAAELVSMIAAGRVEPGARSAAGMVSLESASRWFEGLPITTSVEGAALPEPLYRRVMGAGFADLPETTRAIHRGYPAIVSEGDAEIVAASNVLGRIIAGAFGLPVRSTPAAKVRVVIESGEGEEHWTRYFDGRPMRSVMRAANGGLLEEQFGPLAVTMRLVARADGLDMVRVSGRMGPMPLPAFLLPTIRATERVDAEGRHRFDVEIGAPLVGRLVSYRGWLAV